MARTRTPRRRRAVALPRRAVLREGLLRARHPPRVAPPGGGVRAGDRVGRLARVEPEPGLRPAAARRSERADPLPSYLAEPDPETVDLLHVVRGGPLRPGRCWHADTRAPLRPLPRGFTRSRDRVRVLRPGTRDARPVAPLRGCVPDAVGGARLRPRPRGRPTRRRSLRPGSGVPDPRGLRRPRGHDAVPGRGARRRAPRSRHMAAVTRNPSRALARRERSAAGPGPERAALDGRPRDRGPLGPRGAASQRAQLLVGASARVL